jgi:hypothetical protein
MLTMAVGQSDEVDPADAIAGAIEQCRAALGGLSPQAGILFSAFDSFAPASLTAVREAFPGIAIMGGTSAAEISSIVGYQEDSLTLALFASDDVDVTAGVGAGLGTDVDAACRAAADQAFAGTRREPKVCIVVAEGFVGDAQLTLDAMARALPPGVVIVGGTSARRDFVTVVPTYQFCDDVVATDGVAVLLFSGPLKYSTAVGTGWRTIGVTGTVTSSTYGALHEIDGRPAIEFLARYLDVTGAASYGNPLAVVEADGEESYLRAIQGSDPASGSVLLAGSIPVGATVQLTTADIEEILAGTKAALARATAAFPAGSSPEAGLIFSCAVRKFLLGSRTRVEAELARSAYAASMPLAGMYCFGEMGPIRGTPTSRYLNETFVTLLLGT